MPGPGGVPSLGCVPGVGVWVCLVGGEGGAWSAGLSLRIFRHSYCG